MDSTLYILTGFTAVGKTRMSLDWAKKNGAEIVSCDSLLFYRNMNIGTAKPARDELHEVPHHLINVTEPSCQYSINKYLKAVEQAVAEIHARGKRVLVVGGSGFYLSAFFGPVVDDFRLKSSVKVQIEKEFDGQSLDHSVEVLRKLNPDGLGDLDTKNPRRVLKAWLRCVASGKTLIELKDEFANRSGPFDAFDRKLLILSRPREELEERVKLRVDLMLQQGLVEEVKRLLEEGIERNPSAASAIGYRETIACLRGDLSIDDLAENISLNTRKLLKKQRTWFKKYLPASAMLDLSGIAALPENWHLIPANRR